MIISPLRRTALAAAAVAALSLPAAARSDAAFAASLGKPLAGLATMAELKTRPQIIAAQAPTQGPAVPQAAWIKILNTVRTEGTWLLPEGGSPFGTYKILEPTGDRAPAHTHMAVEIIAKPVTGPAMAISSVRFSAVTLTVHAAGKRIQSWEYITDFEGRVRSAQTVVLNIASDGSVKDETATPLDIFEAANVARYEGMIKYWSGN